MTYRSIAQQDAHVQAFNYWFRTITETELKAWMEKTGYNPSNPAGARA